MSKQANGIFSQERRSKILELLASSGSVNVAFLCEQFNVSPATIRNDLRELEDNNLLQRTHGGAVSKQPSRPEAGQDFLYNPTSSLNEKQAIANAAIGYVQPGDIIAIDVGTTAYEFAKLLANLSNLTVITNDLPIAAYLERCTQFTVIMAGGIVNRESHCTIGQTALDTIGSLHVDKVFATTDGLNPKKGLSTYSMEMANFKSHLMESGDKVFLLADHNKIGKNSLCFYAGLSQIDVLITDDKTPGHIIDSLRQYGIDIVCARQEGAPLTYLNSIPLD